MLAAEIEILAHRHVGEEFAAFGALHDAVARDRRRGLAAQRCALAANVAGIGQQPEMALNSVVLPAPLRPTTETNSPAWTWIDTFSRACALP
jgi:hypothetical protein